MKSHELILEIEKRLVSLAMETEKAKTSKVIRDYLKVMATFHQYSFHNTLAIYAYCLHAHTLLVSPLGRNLAAT